MWSFSSLHAALTPPQLQLLLSLISSSATSPTFPCGAVKDACRLLAFWVVAVLPVSRGICILHLFLHWKVFLLEYVFDFFHRKLVLYCNVFLDRKLVLYWGKVLQWYGVLYWNISLYWNQKQLCTLFDCLPG